MSAAINISKMLKEIMAYNGWSQQELSQRMKFSASQVSRWLAGSQKPRVEAYLKIEEQFKRIPVAFA